MKKVQACDVHGFCNFIYFTLRVMRAVPSKRSISTQLEYLEVTEQMDFKYCMPPQLFYDGRDQSPLLSFASTDFLEDLPAWISYNNINFCFTGVAPAYPVKEVDLQITFVHKQTGANDAVSFRIGVIPNYPPFYSLSKYPHDAEIIINEFFTHHINVAAFYDKETNYYPFINATGPYLQTLPEWLSYNQRNRSLYGVPPSEGVWRVDLHYFDDIGAYSIINVKITAIEKPQVSYYGQIIMLGVLTLMTLVGFFSFWFYLLQFVFNFGNKEKMNRMQRQRRMPVNSFHSYQEIKLEFVQPKTTILKRPKKAAVTSRFDFLSNEKGSLSRDLVIVGS